LKILVAVLKNFQSAIFNLQSAICNLQFSICNLMNLPATLENSDQIQQLLPDALGLLEKDFLQAGIEVNLSWELTGDVFDIRDRVAELVIKTGGPGSEPFYRLLYRADIPESKVRGALESEPGEPLPVKIAELLVIRALQRAFYRLKFG
jgi:hypothetical protein